MVDGVGAQVDIAGSANLKYQRAKEHHQEFVLAIGHYLSQKPFTLDPVPVKIRRSVEVCDVRLNVKHPPVPGIGVVIGDYLHNLRSALDHMTWLLAEVNGPTPHDRTEFPIFLSCERYEQRKRNGEPAPRSGLDKISGLSQPAQEIIASFQPFNSGEQPEQHPLWLLHELSNTDKHRALHFLFTTVSNPEFVVREATNIEIEFVPSGPGPFKDGDTVGQLRIRSIGRKSAYASYDVPVQPTIAFDDGPAKGLPVLATLAKIGRFVAIALDGLSTFVPVDYVEWQREFVPAEFVPAAEFDRRRQM